MINHLRPRWRQLVTLFSIPLRYHCNEATEKMCVPSKRVLSRARRANSFCDGTYLTRYSDRESQTACFFKAAFFKTCPVFAYSRYNRPTSHFAVFSTWSSKWNDAILFYFSRKIKYRSRFQGRSQGEGKREVFVPPGISKNLNICSPALLSNKGRIKLC